MQPQTPELQGELDALRALIALNHDRIQESIRLSERSQQTISPDQTYIHSLALTNLREANGELQLARQTYQQILAETSPAEGQPLPLARLGYVGLGKILREWNRLDEAEAQLHVALRLGKSAALDGVVVDGLITLGLVHTGQRAWHIPLLYLIGMDLAGFGFFILQMIGLSVAMTWAYNRSGTVLAPVLVHGIGNATGGWLTSIAPSLAELDLMPVQAAGPLVLGLLLIAVTWGRLGHRPDAQ